MFKDEVTLPIRCGLKLLKTDSGAFLARSGNTGLEEGPVLGKLVSLLVAFFPGGVREGETQT